MTLPSVLGCQVCSALDKQNVPRSKVFFGTKCASASPTWKGRALSIPSLYDEPNPCLAL